jgi:hypothetical protein
MKGITTMSTRRVRTRLLLTAAVAALALTGGAAESASAASSVKKATKLLQDKRVTIYISGRVTNSTIQRDIDLCRGGSLFYYSVFSSPEAVSEESAQGRWRVVSARIRGTYGWAKVRWSADSYGGTSKLVANRRGVYVDGNPVEFTRSPGC